MKAKEFRDIIGESLAEGLRVGACPKSLIDYEDNIKGMKDYCMQLLASKRIEYAAGADPFYNFRLAAQLQGVSMEEALIGMMDKHVISVHDMVRYGKTYPLDTWREKIADNINYLLILWAMINEREKDE